MTLIFSLVILISIGSKYPVLAIGCVLALACIHAYERGEDAK